MLQSAFRPFGIVLLFAVLASPAMQGCPSTNPPPAAPTIASTADATGGLLVIGDLLDVRGTDLNVVTAALVGDVYAPILSQGRTSLRIQVPAGSVNGGNQVRLVFPSGAAIDEVTTPVVVHRLVVFVAYKAGKIVVADTTDQAVVTTFSLTLDTTPDDGPLYPAFANNGSLAVVPSNAGSLVWIDLTADPPVFGPLNLGGAQVMAVTLAPAGDLLVATDRGSAVYPVPITQAEPPYTNPIISWTTVALTGTPCAPDFFSNANAMAVPLEQDNRIAILIRTGSTLIDTGTRVDSVLSQPIQAKATPDRSQVAAISSGNGVVALYTATAQSLAFAASVTFPNNGALAVDFSPGGDVAYVLDSGRNLLVPLAVTPGSLTELAAAPAPSGTALRSLAVDPVQGRYAYVGQENGNYVDIYDIEASGTTLTRRGANPLAGNANLSDTRGIAIQP
jgi:hypothetical protein